MSNQPTPAGLQLRSLVTSNGELEISLLSVATPTPAPDEVVVRIQATPINPSDMGLLFGAADIKMARVSGTPTRPIVTLQIPEPLTNSMAGRLGQFLAVGNEGAGVVVAAGLFGAAQALLGKPANPTKLSSAHAINMANTGGR